MAAMRMVIFTHLLVISITFVVLVWLIKFPEGSSFIPHIYNMFFKLHPLLMIFGFIMFAREAIVVNKSIRVRTQKLAHLILHFIALVVGTLRVYKAFKFHLVKIYGENPNWNYNTITNLINLKVGPCHHELRFPHNYTLHSWIGMLTICLFSFKWLLARFFCWYMDAESARRARMAPWHVFFGLGIFFMTILTAEIGFRMKFHYLNNLQRGKEEVTVLIIHCIGMLIGQLGISIGLSIIIPWII